MCVIIMIHNVINILNLLFKKSPQSVKGLGFTKPGSSLAHSCPSSHFFPCPIFRLYNVS